MTAVLVLPHGAPEDERWLPVVGHEGRYEVSDLGRVRSVPHVRTNKAGQHRPVPGKVLAASIHPTGYPIVYFSDCGKTLPRKPHILVAEAFLGPRPAGMQVAHNDGNPLNAQVANLRYATPADNAADMVEHGTVIRGSDRHNAKLAEADIAQIISRRKAGAYLRVIADEYGVDRRTIGKIVKGQRWSWLTGIAS